MLIGKPANDHVALTHSVQLLNPGAASRVPHRFNTPTIDQPPSIKGTTVSIESIFQFGIAIAIAGFLLLLIPGIVAFARSHGYKWLILVLGFFGGIISGGVLWLAALVWAVWPKQRSLVDPVIGSPTGLDKVGTGDILGSVQARKERRYREEV